MTVLILDVLAFALAKILPHLKTNLKGVCASAFHAAKYSKI